MTNEAWSARDLAVLWHPCTQMKDHETVPLTPLRRGDGVWLEDFDGRRYLDAVSSWWVNLFGHANPALGAALKDQVDTLEHAIFAGFSHAPAIELAERLVALTPPGLDRVFYADNGSSAVEVALKMSFHYWRNQGRGERRRFISLTNSYHGETLGALALGHVPLYRETYGPLLMETINVESPDCFGREPGESWEACSLRRFEAMERALEQHAHEVCAVIVEPLVQCAAGMRMYHAAWLRRLRDACDRHGVHLIADEIAVGFGRTGTMFACEQAGIAPDFMCLSKGLTGGYLPLSAVLTTDDVYRAFYVDYTKLTAFLHSHSYTGNPLACRVALATLDVFAREPVLERNRATARRMRALAAPLADHPAVAEVRQTGMILAVELGGFPWQERRGLRGYRHALSRGVLLRPIGDVFYWMPPYVIDDDALALLAEVTAEAVDVAAR